MGPGLPGSVDLIKDDEVLMLAKTSEDNFETVAELVEEIHSYDVPEVIAADLTQLSDGYSSFLRDVLSGR